MIAQSHHLLRLLLARLRHCHRQPVARQHCIEAAFGACYHHWSEVAALAAHHRFASPDEEIDFFRNIKPRFIALIDYYQLVYHSTLFLPDLTTGHARTFWERESRRLPEFVRAHAPFVHYWKSGRREKDSCYFTQVAPPGGEPLVLFDNVLGRLLALERYDRYVQRQWKDRTANGDG